MRAVCGFAKAFSRGVAQGREDVADFVDSRAEHDRSTCDLKGIVDLDTKIPHRAFNYFWGRSG
jgi:hypothetical protein